MNGENLERICIRLVEQRNPAFLRAFGNFIEFFPGEAQIFTDCNWWYGNANFAGMKKELSKFDDLLLGSDFSECIECERYVEISAERVRLIEANLGQPIELLSAASQLSHLVNGIHEMMHEVFIARDAQVHCGVHDAMSYTYIMTLSAIIKEELDDARSKGINITRLGKAALKHFEQINSSPQIDEISLFLRFFQG